MPMVAESFKLIRQSEAVVKEALNSGVVDLILGTQLSVADGYVLCSMKDGFLEEWLSHFPDPRQEKEISEKVILVGSLAAAFQGVSLRKWRTLCSAWPDFVGRIGLWGGGIGAGQWHHALWDRAGISLYS